MENFNINLKVFSEYVVNIIYDINNFDIKNTKEQKVSPIKLQNLLYFVYAYALATWNKKLWSNDFEKWAIGPVIPEIYHNYSKNGVRLYNREKHFVKIPEIPTWDRLDLEALVIDISKKYNDIELAKLAYDDVWKNTKINSIIKTEDIAKYYSENETFIDEIVYDPTLENNTSVFSRQMVNKKDTKYKIGRIIHIGLPFKSHDGKLLRNRFMCIFSIKSDDLALMPMSTFHSEKQKDWKLNHSKEKETIFEYSEKHGNNKDGYLKSNQLYFLTKKECDFSNKIYIYLIQWTKNVLKNYKIMLKTYKKIK